MSELTIDQVAHLARLARLELTESEAEQYRVQLGEILASVAKIAEVAVESVPPLAHPQPLVNVWRADENRPCVDRDEVLAAAPATEGDRFRVPRILDED